MLYTGLHRTTHRRPDTGPGWTATRTGTDQMTETRQQEHRDGTDTDTDIMLYTAMQPDQMTGPDQIQIQIHAQPDQTAGPDDRTSEDRARIHSRQQQITGPGTDNSTRQNPKHLTGTATQLVSRQLQQQQEPGNPERKTETQAGTGQKKQLSQLGDSFVCKCATLYLNISNKNRLHSWQTG